MKDPYIREKFTRERSAASAIMSGLPISFRKCEWLNSTLSRVPHCLYFSTPLSFGIRQGTFEVAEYRAYIVGDDDHFIGFEEMVCRDDGEAVASAKRLVDGHDIEVWNGERLVVRLKAKIS
jgi:hypothetical protein